MGVYNSDLENKNINYLGKDFNSFKTNLTEFAKTYFPTVYNDFSAASPGTMFVEIAAYVGDVLSYYMDSQLKENLLPYAKERSNVINLANTLGYKTKPTKASKCKVNLFAILPAKNDGTPDWLYAPTLLEDSVVQSTQGNVKFTIDRDVKFGFSSSMDPTTTTVYQLNTTTNLPAFFLLKKSVNASSGQRKSTSFAIGDVSERYRKLELAETDVIEIEKITDSQGNEWREVPYLAQETVFIEAANTSAIDQELSQGATNAPYLLKLRKTSKRFITRTTNNNTTSIVFGSGVSTVADELIIPNPENVGMNSQDGVSKLDRAFDPSNFLQTRTYGEAPRNTTLTVYYKTGGGTRSNVGAGTITKVDTAMYQAPHADAVPSIFNSVKASLAVNNESAAMGGSSAETVSEIKRNAMAHFQGQNRIVTREDYIGRIYSMPPRFGNITKAYVAPDTVLNRASNQIAGNLEQDPLTGIVGVPEELSVSNPNATNIYLLGFDRNKKLSSVVQAVKENLKTYLTPYRMMTDAMNIKDGFIVNIGVEFEIIVLPNHNNNEVLIKCINEVRKHFDIDRWQFNEPITISKITNKLANTEGVQSVQEVKIVNKWKASQGYSGNKYDISTATVNGIIYPPLDPSVFELKFPQNDIKGSVATY